jgi:hypothetical protein
MALPAACSDCLTTLQMAQPGSLPQQTPWQLFRAGDGRTRLNYGDISIIHNPKTAMQIVLDHVAQQARMMPSAPGEMPGMPGLPSMPGMPGFAPPGMPGSGGGMNVIELGKSMMQGEPVEGRRFMLGPGSMAEVWTNTKLQLPVLSTFSGSFGQQTCRCRNTSFGEPDPSLFQIPPNYSTISPPAMPNLPR